MPVVRHRSPAGAGRPAGRAVGDQALAAAVRELWRFGSWLAPWSLPPGVHRWRSITALNLQRRLWERERVTPRFRPVTPPTSSPARARTTAKGALPERGKVQE